MISISTITHLLETEYGVEALAVEPFGPENADRQAYRITTRDGKQWLARLQRSAPAWLPAADSATWMLQQAAMLEWCARHAYPAPRHLRTLSGAPLTQLEEWYVSLTEYIEGKTVLADAASWRKLSEMLGRLHPRAQQPGSNPY